MYVVFIFKDIKLFNLLNLFLIYYTIKLVNESCPFHPSKIDQAVFLSLGRAEVKKTRTTWQELLSEG